MRSDALREWVARHAPPWPTCRPGTPHTLPAHGGGVVVAGDGAQSGPHVGERFSTNARRASPMSPFALHMIWVRFSMSRA